MSMQSADNDPRCCVPDGGEEHCNHHPEWHDKRRCNHPACSAIPPEAGRS